MRTKPIDIALQLLPCPFCNAPAGKATKKATLFPSRRKVSCSDDDCGAHYGYWAPDEWNRRASQAAPIAQTAPEQRDKNTFRDAVIDHLVVLHIYEQRHDEDPRQALADLIALEVDMALDPHISKRAADLVRLGKCDGTNQQ